MSGPKSEKLGFSSIANGYAATLIASLPSTLLGLVVVFVYFLIDTGHAASGDELVIAVKWFAVAGLVISFTLLCGLLCICKRRQRPGSMRATFAGLTHFGVLPLLWITSTLDAGVLGILAITILYGLALVLLLSSVQWRQGDA
ncbi:MAG: hypothetical protein AAF747_01965 [Planctomycetota bacterium]